MLASTTPILLALAIYVPALAGQQPAGPQTGSGGGALEHLEGQTIRIRGTYASDGSGPGPEWVVGTVLASRGDTLFLQGVGQREVLSSVVGPESRLEQRRQGDWSAELGAGGALLGALAGGMIASSRHRKSEFEPTPCRTAYDPWEALGCALGGSIAEAAHEVGEGFEEIGAVLLGATVGATALGVTAALVGHSLKRERWERVDRLHVSLAAVPDGRVTMGVRIAH